MPTSPITSLTLLPNSFRLPPSLTTTWVWTSQPAVLQDKDLVPSLWLAAFAALIGTSLTNEHNALLQHPLIPPQFPSRVIAPLLARDVDTVTDYVTEILACTGPSWAVKNRRPRSSGSQSPLTMHPFKSSRVPL